MLISINPVTIVIGPELGENNKNNGLIKSTIFQIFFIENFLKIQDQLGFMTLSTYWSNEIN